MVEVPGYQIQRLLSWGSQGDVFLAIDAQGHRVALKIVTPERVEGEYQAAERLRREGRLLAAISSPHVVQVREFLEAPEWSCLVLQYLEGRRLDAAIRERAGEAPEQAFDARASTVVLPREAKSMAEGESAPKAAVMLAAAALQTEGHVQWSLGVGVQFARGVSALHGINLVHRDLKPQNAMLVGDQVVLIDFGFARMDGMTTLTQSGAAIGTLAFMSPEQFRGSGATKQSDVYGLGATIYYLLTGLAPVDAGVASIAAIGTRRFAPSVRQKNPAVPKSLNAVLLRALQPDPRDRYQEACEVLADLERCQRGEPVRLPFSVSRLWRQRRRQLAGLAAFLLVGVVAMWLFAGFSSAREAQNLLDEVMSGPEAAPRRWQGLDENQRDQVTYELNERVGADSALAEVMARQLHLGLLRVEGRRMHRGVLMATNGEEAPLGPAVSEFLSLEQPRSLLVRPGRAWFLVKSDNQTAWWSAEDPLVMHLLIDVPEPGSVPVEVRSLDLLPTETRIVGSLQSVLLNPAELSSNGLNKAFEIHSSDPIAVCIEELDVATASLEAAWLHSYVANHEDLDDWLAHPAEPPGEASAFWLWVTEQQASPVRDRMPLKCSFWFAHRLAALLGCRLPTVREWQRVAFDGGKALGNEAQRVITDEVPVDMQTTWDRTASGLYYLNSNVAEWTLETRKGSFVAMPMSGRMEGQVEGKRMWLAASPLLGKPAGALAGLRLYRTMVPVR